VCDIDLKNNHLIPVPKETVTSTKVTMEMIVGSVTQDENGNTKVNYFVKFSTENGNHILYPWEGLKEMVLKWLEVEKEQ
jgi:hypothetical protein